MHRVPWILAIDFMLVPFLIAACGGTPTGSPTGATGTSIAGSYGCSREGAGPNVPSFVWELRADGTLQNISPADIVALGTTAEEKIVSGTWTAAGNSGKVTSENVDYPFTIDGGKLVFRDGSFVCGPIPPPG